MDTPAKTIRTAALVGIAALVIYAPFLNYSPIYVAHDEVLFALQAHAIASSGHDLHGTAAPLYFPVLRGYWAQPLVVYFTALFLKLLPLSETAIRLPTVMVGVADVVLMYLAARRLFNREDVAVVAAGMLALTPSHFLNGRLAVDALYPLPFITAWLLCLLGFEKRGQPWLLCTGALVLGVGFYTYIASVVMMPIYFAITCVVLFLHGAKPRLYGLAVAGFFVPLVPFLVWLLQHPSARTELLSRYQLNSVVATVHYHVLVERLSLYWNCFNPAFLFVSAEDNPVNTTFRTGVFLVPMAAFVAIGLHRIANAVTSRVNLILLVGLLSAPLGVVIVGERTIPRLLFMVPFAVLIGAAGVARVLDSRRRLWRLAGVCLLTLMPIQFAYFAFDYFTAYRERSGAWMEHNMRGALTEVMAGTAQADDRRIYLAQDIPWADEYWRFFAIANRREDLLDRASQFDPAAAWTMPPRSLILTTYDPKRHHPLAAAAGARQVATVSDADDVMWFSIFQSRP
jgi:4-amino-4-deoxy-L-arabinose transferase-like glycosyltransferase